MHGIIKESGDRRNEDDLKDISGFDSMAKSSSVRDFGVPDVPDISKI